MTKQNFTLVLAAMLFATGCAPAPPDYGPIGSGLTAIAVCLVVYGVVGVLGELVRNKPSQPPESTEPPKREPPRRKRRESPDKE
jgi:hypothetical protein